MNKKGRLRQMAMDAWQENRAVNDLNFVEDGEQLMLYRRKEFAALAGAPPPGMILLDLNMPWLEIVELPPEDAEA